MSNKNKIIPLDTITMQELFENAGTKPFRVVQRILVFALLWTMAEWKKSTGFLAYPWGTILMTAYDWNFITQIADITGTWGISFLFALFNAVIAEGLCRIPEIPHFSTNKSQRAYSFVAAATIVLSPSSTPYIITALVPTNELLPIVILPNMLLVSFITRDAEKSCNTKATSVEMTTLSFISSKQLSRCGRMGVQIKQPFPILTPPER